MQNIIINGRFLTKPLSGVQRTAIELIRAIDQLFEQGLLKKQDISFTILYSGQVINPIELKHVKILKRGFFKGNLWEQLELPMYSAGKMLLSLCSISTLLKRKQMVMVHDASFLVNKQYFSNGFRRWYTFAIPLLAKIARQIITVSAFSKSELVKYGGLDVNKITVLPNAADHILACGSPNGDFINKINAMKPYCLAVSNLAVNKNFEGLNAAISHIDFSGYKMLIAGGVMSTLEYEAPTGDATYLGYVSDEELKYLYQHASLFIFPSFYEGFGIPPLEAMILGCPVIASETSSLPEVLGNACHYFNPNDPTNMAEKISVLISDQKELDRLKLAGYRQAAKYSWHNSAIQLINLISKYSA